jgi:hypothetical protein
VTDHALRRAVQIAMDDQVTRTSVELALGRIFRLASRPTKPGDVEEYERCRAIIMDAIAPDGVTPDYTPCWARDRLSGAQGD